ncbi:hypothetical protein XAC3562_1810001 [Xanthomonas citri pv. citri]|uniref:Uncharacterized protein n=1 Tax=Xanthomonas citri pv. citri TaxID=611301 RepID=A0A0U5FAL7_XANCI|nr:hypothetical protein XAC3562_1810001 [Xanthomonas citri pv. citri]CEI03619.1 hypothetical protein XACG117_3330001 [Xanthomonas citri pv. citri]
MLPLQVDIADPLSARAACFTLGRPHSI